MCTGNDEGKMGVCEHRHCGEPDVYVLPVTFRYRGGKKKVEWYCESCYWDEMEDRAEARERACDDYLDQNSWSERQSDLYELWQNEY